MAQVKTVAVVGSESLECLVEAVIQNGLPDFQIIGFPPALARKSARLVRSSITTSGYKWPLGRVVISLSPTQAYSFSRGHTLPIAYSILKASRQVALPDDQLFFGELNLNGESRPHFVYAALQRKHRQLLVPTSLRSLSLNGQSSRGWSMLNTQPKRMKDRLYLPAYALRLLMISAVGRHHLLITGRPGVGKSESAACVHRLLAPPTQSQTDQLTFTRYSSGHDISDYSSPHIVVGADTTSTQLMGRFRPGEYALAHTGVLEVSELHRHRLSTLTCLSELMEKQVIKVDAQELKLCYAALPLCIGTANNCLCGRRGEIDQNCSCTQSDMSRYRQKLSASLLDRFDLFMRLDKVTDAPVVNEEEVNTLVAAATTRVIEGWDQEAKQMLSRAEMRLGLSYRAVSSLKRVAETITKVDNQPKVGEQNVLEALQYRVRPV